jgi:hypothetical protein
VTLTNTGTANLIMTSIGIGGVNYANFAQTNNCPGTLVPGASCTISVTCTPNYTGARNATVALTDNSGNVNGAQQSVTLTATGTLGAVPAPVSISPINGTGSSQTFTLIYSDASGYQGIQEAYVLFNPALTAAYGCYIQYTPATNQITLGTDAGTSFLTPITVGSTTPLTNDQCSVTASGFSVSGSNFTLTLAIAFASGYSGQRNVYMSTNAAAGASGWVLEGTWTPSPRQAVTVGSISPINGAGLSQTFSVGFPDPNGTSDMLSDYILINSSSYYTNACWIYYSPTANSYYLRNDGNTAWLGPVAPGSSTQLSNSQCTLTGSSITATPGGDTVGISLTFSATFTGSKNVYVETNPFSPGTSTGLVLKGTWVP